MDLLLEQFDMLDTVLAVFGALIFAMWFGRGKTLSGILTGAFLGGVAKPALFLVLGFTAVAALSGPGNDTSTSSASQHEQDEILKFWTK